MNPFVNLTLFALALGLGSAETNDSGGVFSAPIRFDFNAPGGQYESEGRAITCAVNAVQGSVSIHEYRWDRTYHPGMKVFLTRGTGPDERLISLAFSAMHFRPPFSVKFGSAQDDTKDLGSVRFSAAVGQTGTFSFLIRWNAAGDVTAAVDGEQHMFSLGGRPERLQINGSGGVGNVTYELGHLRDEIGDRDCKPIA